MPAADRNRYKRGNDTSAPKALQKWCKKQEPYQMNEGRARSLAMPDRKKLAARKDEPVICRKCGKRTKRQMRGQRYCSRICRERARRRSRKAFLDRTARAPATPKKNRKDFNALAAAIRRSSHGICGPAKVIEAECFAGRKWKLVISPDGVPVHVTRRRNEPRNV